MEKPNQPESPADIERSRLDKLRGRKSALYKQNMLGFHEDSAKHAQMVEAEYKKQGKNVRQYKAFHMLIGSTIEDDNKQPFYDFPEPEYSVEKFIEKKEKEKTIEVGLR